VSSSASNDFPNNEAEDNEIINTKILNIASAFETLQAQAESVLSATSKLFNITDNLDKLQNAIESHIDTKLNIIKQEIMENLENLTLEVQSLKQQTQFKNPQSDDKNAGQILERKNSTCHQPFEQLSFNYPAFGTIHLFILVNNLREISC
jgi:hypothetical protein